MTDPRRKQPSDDRDDTSTKGGSTMRGIQNNASGKPSTLIKPGIVNRMDDTVGVIMSGSMRGMLILLAKKISLKAIVKKKAFLTIGGMADSASTEKNYVVVKKPPSQMSSSLMMGFSYSRYIVSIECMLMGMIVFGTYELTVKGWKRRHCLLYQRTDDSTTSYDNLGYDPSIGQDMIFFDAPLVVHTVAGLVAGLAHSLFWMTWEATVHQSNWLRKHPKFCQRTMVHHAVGYGALFGSYHATRQALVTLDPLSLLKGLGQLPITFQDDNNDNSEGQRRWESSDPGTYYYTTMDGTSSLKPVAYTILAGGVAGQTHHMINHYTSHWRQFRRTIPPLPRFRPAMVSFWTMSLCFTAFEHGSDCVDYVVEFMEETILRFSTSR